MAGALYSYVTLLQIDSEVVNVTKFQDMDSPVSNKQIKHPTETNAKWLRTNCKKKSLVKNITEPNKPKTKTLYKDIKTYRQLLTKTKGHIQRRKQKATFRGQNQRQRQKAKTKGKDYRPIPKTKAKGQDQRARPNAKN